MGIIRHNAKQYYQVSRNHWLGRKEEWVVERNTPSANRAMGGKAVWYDVEQISYHDCYEQAVNACDQLIHNKLGAK